MDGEDNITEFSLSDKDKVKYNALKTIDEGGLKYRVTLNISNVQEEEGRYRYKAVVTNSLGRQEYFFKLNVEPDESSGGRGGSKAGLVFGIIALLVVTAIILGSIYVYKRKKESSSTVPMMNLDT